MSVPGLTGCSQPGGDPTAVAEISEALLTPATTNHEVAHAVLGARETSVAFSPYQRRWIVGFNSFTSTATEAGWAYSSDPSGTSWTSSSISSATAWGDPGSSPTNGSGFIGWRGDPSIAPATNPSFNQKGLTMLYSMVGSSKSADASDVVIARSNDGGLTWGQAQYVNDAASGGNVDNPVMDSNPVAPYHTYVAWTNGSGAWLNDVQYGPGNSFTKGTPTKIPPPPSAAVLHPNIAVGQYTTCGSEVHEAVYVAFTTSGGRCAFDGTAGVQSNSWWLALYDTVDKSWAGPWQMNSDDKWANCVGTGYKIANDPRPRIAVDSQSATFWTAHTQSSPYGTRPVMDWGGIVCSDGTTTPSVSHDQPYFCYPKFPGCNRDGQGWNDGSGNPIIQDEWGPALAFTYQPGSPAVPRTVLTWYSTRDGAAHANQFATIYMQYSEEKWASGGGAPRAISVKTAGSSETVPWDQTLSDWSDYQALGVNPLSGTILGAWGGDTRDGSTGRIYSTLLQ